ncbi:c-type cytochrome [Fulvimarina pelagi]|uniref:c-type cytochrome n=1 Tax=Fulvimarina pelagi TaxID=217511 RepID=UPI003CC77831
MLRAARFRLLAPLFPVERGRFRRRPRRLCRALQPEHQIDQFVLRKPPQIISVHLTMDSEDRSPDKGVGNYAQAAYGEDLFEENCAACHVENTAESEQGPPLIHRIYEPNHHGDQAFLIEATQGARAHHWQFGNMPPVEGITPRQVRDIVAYVREVQAANDIF